LFLTSTTFFFALLEHSRGRVCYFRNVTGITGIASKQVNNRNN